MTNKEIADKLYIISIIMTGTSAIAYFSSSELEAIKLAAEHFKILSQLEPILNKESSHG